MREVFGLAKTMIEMPLDEVRLLLASDDHLHRVGAVSVMDFRARRTRITDEERAALYDLYLGEHDHINTWDLVDRAAPHVVGGYLHDHDRTPLYELAGSSDRWRRRTSVVATWFFIRRGDLDDVFALADLLAHDPEEVVQAAVGGFVREAGKRDPVTSPCLPRPARARVADHHLPARDPPPVRGRAPVLPQAGDRRPALTRLGARREVELSSFDAAHACG